MKIHHLWSPTSENPPLQSAWSENPPITVAIGRFLEKALHSRWTFRISTSPLLYFYLEYLIDIKEVYDE